MVKKGIKQYKLELDIVENEIVVREENYEYKI